MPLTLRILSYRKEAPATPVERRFDHAGGTIGRAAGNDLELPDPAKYISRNHARVAYADGRYTLMDLGANASWINDRPVGTGKAAPLAHGDRVLIGDYELEALVDEPAAPAYLPPPGAAPLAPAAPIAVPAPVVMPAPVAIPAPLAPAPMYTPVQAAPHAVFPDAVAPPQARPAGGLGAPSAADPLGLGLLGGGGHAPVITTVEPAFRGSEPDDVAPQFMPLPGARLTTPPPPPAYVPPAEATILTTVAAALSAQAQAGAQPAPVGQGGWPAQTLAPAVPAPAAPAPAALLIPADYDPLADFLPPAAPAAVPPPPMPAPAWPAPAQSAPQPFAHAGLQPAPPYVPHHVPQHVPQPVSQHVPQPVSPAAAHAPAQEGEVLQALLRGLGVPQLRPTKTPAQTAELAGAMLREAIAGTMSVLLARAATKRESQLDVTMLGAQANNPLKFFPDAESALAQMLTNAMAGYLPPVKAVGSAFDDLRAHELALMAGMRAALAGVLARFNPALIEAQAEPAGVMEKMLAAHRKAKMWDRMVELYGEVLREADDDFQHLFGERFAQAYADQVARLQQR